MKYAKYEEANKIVCEMDDLHSLESNYVNHIDFMPDRVLNDILKKVTNDYFKKKQNELDAKLESL